MPPPYDKVKRMVVPDALKVLRLAHGHKCCKLGELSSAVGWKHADAVAGLEAARKERSAAFYAEKKAKAEKLVRASGLDWTIVRPPTIYGPRDREVLELFRAARWGVVPMPPKEGRSSLIHVDDLARLLLALVPAARNVSGKVFEPDDGKPGGWSQYELARAIGWAVGRRPWVLHLPQRTLERVAWADGRLRGARAKLTRDRVSYMCHPDWVVRERARVPARLWRAEIESRSGLQATAQWYREAGWL